MKIRSGFFRNGEGTRGNLEGAGGDFGTASFAFPRDEGGPEGHFALGFEGFDFLFAGPVGAKAAGFVNSVSLDIQHVSGVLQRSDAPPRAHVQNWPVCSNTKVQASSHAIPAEVKVACKGAFSVPGLKITRLGFSAVSLSFNVNEIVGPT